MAEFMGVDLTVSLATWETKRDAVFYVHRLRYLAVLLEALYLLPEVERLMVGCGGDLGVGWLFDDVNPQDELLVDGLWERTRKMVEQGSLPKINVYDIENRRKGVDLDHGDDDDE